MAARGRGRGGWLVDLGRSGCRGGMQAPALRDDEGDVVSKRAAQVLEFMAADPCGIVHLKFGQELVPMQQVAAKQWSKVLATALATEEAKAGQNVIIPMDCTKDDWLTVMSFCYATSPHPIINWENLEVLIKVADKFDMSAILDMCDNFLVTCKHQLAADPNDGRFGWKWIVLADNAGLGSAAKACFDAVHRDWFASTAATKLFARECSRQIVDRLSPELMKHILLAYAASCSRA